MSVRRPPPVSQLSYAFAITSSPVAGRFFDASSATLSESASCSA